MFQAIRPLVTWSAEASRRARLYGSLNVVDAVPISPRCSVAAAIPVSRTVGSSAFHGWIPGSESSDGWSARNSASSVPRSAMRAMFR